MTEFNGTPFQYNPMITNVNIDNQLAGILTQFDEDYIIDTVRTCLNNRFRVYDLPSPNVVAAYEANFKQLTEGFSSNTEEILVTRRNVYVNIINEICNFYGLIFNDRDDTDYYSAAYWLYDFLVSNFTENLKNFYVMYLINEKDSLELALGLTQLRKENDATYSYSKKLFKDPKLAAIHCNLEYVIQQMSTYSIDLWSILSCTYQNNTNLPEYVYSLITDSGNFFENYYESFILESKDAADILTYIKLSLQQVGGLIEPVEV